MGQLALMSTPSASNKPEADRQECLKGFPVIMAKEKWDWTG